MTPKTDYVGRQVYSSDEKRLGKVKNIWDGAAYEAQHVVVIGRLMGNDVFVPSNVLHESGDRLVVPYEAAFIKSGPPLSEDRGASAEDMHLLDAYYRTAA